jgi:23S rRNA (uracil1939-C5)-methyltransferase
MDIDPSMNYFCSLRRKNRNIILEKVLVEDYAAEGRSLARVDGKVVFIESVVPGDVADIKLFKSKKDWAEGYPVRFHLYSPDRVIPFCSHFGVCGGCQWQMLPYDKQLLYKQQQVFDNLQRIGGIALPDILPIIGADETMHYRNKMEYAFSSDEFLPLEEFLKRKELNQVSAATGVAGFHAKGVFDKVVNIDTCYLQPEPGNSLRQAIKSFALQHGFSFYDFRRHQGFLRALQLRTCTTGEVMANMIYGYEDQEKNLLLMNFIREQFPGITTLLYTINTKKNDSLYGLEPRLFYGKGYVTEKLETFTFRIGPKSFFQTNTRQAEKLYSVARAFAELSGAEIIYDLYCGTGSIGIFLSRQARKIIGVDMEETAIEDARVNAALNELNHAVFIAGDVIDICGDDFFETHGKPDVIITDPPRAGMHPLLLRKILDMQAPVVVYVSCNPATQARDLSVLDEKYRVTKVQPVDMFPHTHHIENVVQLKLKK